MPDHHQPPGGETPNDVFAFHDLGGGQRLRYAVFDPPATPRGTFLIAQGRREFIEKKEFELGRDLRTRGFRVIAFDWRGQGLSSRFLERDKRQRDHLRDFSIYLADLRSFYDGIVKPRQTGPLLVFAHSMGALVALHWLAQAQPTEMPAAALIMSSPALALGLPHFSEGIAHMAEWIGFGEAYAPGQHDYGAADRKFSGNVLTHDPERFAVMEKYFTANPDMAVGGVTWGWLQAAMKAMDDIRPSGYLERIEVPMLALTGSEDKVTPASKLWPLIKRLPKAEQFLIEGARHDLMNEADLYRNQAWRHIDRFLEGIFSSPLA